MTNQSLFEDESFEKIPKIITKQGNIQDYTGKAIENRNESYKKIQKKIPKQCIKIIKSVGDGIKDAWSISEKTGMLVQSVRARMNEMSNMDKYSPTILLDVGNVWNAETNRSVTVYGLTNEGEKIYQDLVLKNFYQDNAIF